MPCIQQRSVACGASLPNMDVRFLERTVIALLQKVVSVVVVVLLPGLDLL